MRALLAGSADETAELPGWPIWNAMVVLARSTASRPAKPMLQGFARTKQPIWSVDVKVLQVPAGLAATVGVPPSAVTWLVCRRKNALATRFWRVAARVRF